MDTEGLRQRPSKYDAVKAADSDYDDSTEDKLLKPHNKQRRYPVPRGIKWVAILLTIVSLWTRLYKINWADFVVWDEAHFGKFAGHYIKRTFYFDVHPPLGKMLNGFAGMLAGFNGTFEFESGAKYPPELKYGVMRFVNGLFGAFMVPLAYQTGVQLRLSQPAAILLATMVIVDNAICTISRFILLDSMLLFMTALATYCLCMFRNHQKDKPFTPEWFFWLCMSGISLGLVLSVKWVGLFAIALVGLHTVEDLWEMFGNLKMPIKTYIYHWIWRIVFLIITPATVYMLSFGAHFGVLNHSGPGDAQMSSIFQAGLVGNDFSSNPLELAYGSKVTFKNNARGGGLLHSHVQRYPGGSEQQQITCYHHKDNNNDWIIKKAWGQPEPDPENVEFVKDGDVVRLVHAMTLKNLHSHNVPAPLSTAEYEVSGYGNATIGDVNDHWVVERVDDWGASRSNRIRSLTTRFRLRHQVLGCLLHADNKALPQWGFKQTETVCQKKPDRESRSSMWNIEEHSHPTLPAGGKTAYKPDSIREILSAFLRDFIDLNVGMWTSNNALTPDPDKEPDQLVSSPQHWPFMIRGLRICGWADSDIKFYLLGNPFIWWFSSISLAVLSVSLLVYIIRAKRGYRDFKTFDEWDDFYFAFKVGVLGWFLHYFPFYIMGRVMYLHHYFPALYFAIIAFAVTLDHFGSKFNKIIHYSILGTAFVVSIGMFLFFADFTFGFTGPASAYANRRWLSTWNIYSNE